MSAQPVLFPSAEFRARLRARGGETAARCYQCATCSSVCELAPAGAPFPRRQMLAAQWGLGDRLAGDPAVWLCHQCNDCSQRCPRDAKPGDVLQAVRSLAVERLAAPAFMGRLVAHASRTWPLLLGLPILFWIVLLALTTGFRVPTPSRQKIVKQSHAAAELFVGEALAEGAEGGHATVAGRERRIIYEQFVPHVLIYTVYFTIAGLVLIAIITSAIRFWKLLGRRAPRRGVALAHLLPVLGEIASHRRFGQCEAARPRKWGHDALFWGFVGAAATSALLIVAMYVTREPLPLAQGHPYKILGNLSALLLIAGATLLVTHRLRHPTTTGASHAFDIFFLAVVVLLVATGVLSELGAFIFAPALACSIYVVHLGTALCLFTTFPYSKFAHMVYRTMAMVHERMAIPASPPERDWADPGVIAD